MWKGENVMKKRISVIVLGITLVICLTGFILLKNGEAKISWTPSIKQLSWGMSLEEVDEKYDLVEEEVTQVKEYKVIPMSEPQTIYGHEMVVYLYFSTLGSGGLARIVGYFDEAQEEVLFEQLRETYGGYEKYWNNQHVEEVYSQEQIKQAYSNVLDGHELNDITIETMGKKPLCYIKLGEAENGQCAFIMDATMEVLMNTSK